MERPSTPAALRAALDGKLHSLTCSSVNDKLVNRLVSVLRVLLAEKRQATMSAAEVDSFVYYAMGLDR